MTEPEQLELFKQGPAAKGRMIRRHAIGLFGHKQHGKDTVAAMLGLALGGQHGYRVKQFALADPLKRVAIELLGMPSEIAFGNGVTVDERERLRDVWMYRGKNARQWLQWIGTELGREQIDPELWVKRAVDTVVDDTKGYHFFVVSDCRFHNEREELASRFDLQFVRFTKVRIHRPGAPIVADHPSESELTEMTDDQFDYVLSNDSTIEALEEKVRVLAGQLVEQGVYVE